MADMNNLLVLLVVCSALCVEGISQYCTTDTDCADLGKSLMCVKSACDRGLCGCKRGYAARFLGGEYKCVQLKRIGESCSAIDSTGVCGVRNSVCNIETNKCECNGNDVPLADGEVCDAEGTSFPGETCRPDILNGCFNSLCTNQGGNNIYGDVAGGIPTCACQKSEDLVMENQVYGTNENVNDREYFMGRKQPQCVTKSFGSVCIDDNECPSNLICTSNKCSCSGADVPNYDGTSCDPAGGKGKGVTCVPGECNESLGLLCGNTCDATELVADRKCTCGPHHRDAGSSCTPIVQGSECYGDNNCKRWSRTGVCEKGTCVDGGSTVIAPMVWLLLSVLVIRLI